MDEANGQLADIIVSKFSELLEQMELIENSGDLEKDLSKNELLKRDIETIVGHITPYISMIGVISGGITVGGHVVSKKMSRSERSKRDPSEFPQESTKEEEGCTSTTEDKD